MSDRPESTLPTDPFPDREPILRRTWLRRLRAPGDRETLERFEYLLYQLGSEATVHWGGRRSVRELLRAAVEDLGSVALFLWEVVAESPHRDDPLQERARAWSLQLARLVSIMDAALGGVGPEPASRHEGSAPAGPQELVEDALALLRLAARVARRVPSVESTLEAGDRERFAWASMAESLQHDLYGGHVGGSLEEPLEDSVLGRVVAMGAWSRERWGRLFDNELLDLKGRP